MECFFSYINTIIAVGYVNGFKINDVMNPMNKTK